MQTVDHRHLQDLVTSGCTFDVYLLDGTEPVETLVPDDDIIVMENPDLECTFVRFRPVGLMGTPDSGWDWNRVCTFTADWFSNRARAIVSPSVGGTVLVGKRYYLVAEPGTGEVDWRAWQGQKDAVVVGGLREKWLQDLEA